MTATLPSRKAGPPAFAVTIATKGTERLGKRQLWWLVATARQLGSTTTGTALRDALRSLNVFVSDSEYAELCASCGGEQSIDLDVFCEKLFSVLSPRRRHAVDLVLAKLDPQKTGVISFQTLDREYDVLRHPSVVSGLRDADDVTAEFFDALVNPQTGVCDDTLSREELIGCYLGISVTMASDEEFELLCIRSFCLDRPRFNVNEEVEQLAGSRAHSRQSRLLGQGKTNPLYTTCNEEYGKKTHKEPAAKSQHGRSQKFTKSAAGHASTATSMNM